MQAVCDAVAGFRGTRDELRRAVRSSNGHDADDQRERAARAALQLADATIGAHGDPEQRRAWVQGHGPDEGINGGSFTRELGPDGRARLLVPASYEAAWRGHAAALTREAATWATSAVRAFARETAVARRIDPTYLVREREEEVRDAVIAELLPWLLGHTDPLEARIARRDVKEP